MGYYNQQVAKGVLVLESSIIMFLFAVIFLLFLFDFLLSAVQLRVCDWWCCAWLRHLIKFLLQEYIL